MAGKCWLTLWSSTFNACDFHRPWQTDKGSRPADGRKLGSGRLPPQSHVWSLARLRLRRLEQQQFLQRLRGDDLRVRPRPQLHLNEGTVLVKAGNLRSVPKNEEHSGHIYLQEQLRLLREITFNSNWICPTHTSTFSFSHFLPQRDKLVTIISAPVAAHSQWLWPLWGPGS